MTEEKLDELENDVRSSLFGKVRTWVSCRIRFLGLPGAPLSLNLHGNAKLRQREHPVFSPEHLSFRAPVFFSKYSDSSGLGRSISTYDKLHRTCVLV